MLYKRFCFLFYIEVFCFFTEAKAAREAGWTAVLVDRSLEQDGSIDIDDETRQNFQVIENLHDLFGDDDLDELERYEEVSDLCTVYIHISISGSYILRSEGCIL